MTRRHFAGSLTAGTLGAIRALAAPERGQVRIDDVQVMILQGPRTYTLVKVLSDQGIFGISEGYGSPAVGVKEGILELRSSLIGKDPLQVESIYNGLGFRTNGSGHTLIRAVSAIETAIWDLAGKILGTPVSTLLGGRYRDRIRLCHDEGPRDMLSTASCAEWAAQMKAHPAGFTAFRISPQRSKPHVDKVRDEANRLLTAREIRDIRQGCENCRNSIGSDYDLVIHCNFPRDLRTAIQFAEGLEPIKPLFLEDPMPPDFSRSWIDLTAASPVPIATGENLARRHGFKDFILNRGCDIVEVDVRNAGGLLESKKIADLADLFYLPVSARHSGSVVSDMQTAQWAASVRDFLIMDTSIGRGNWMDDIIMHDGPVVREGYLTVSDKPGLGIELNEDVVRQNLAEGEKFWN